MSNTEVFDAGDRIFSEQFGAGTVVECSGDRHPRFGMGYLVLFDRKPVKFGMKTRVYVFQDEIRALTPNSESPVNI